ncbi:MAG TPA: hypothetical protein VI251_06380 [Pseudolabrys sp.]|jgi:hypothetical protein
MAKMPLTDHDNTVQAIASVSETHLSDEMGRSAAPAGGESARKDLTNRRVVQTADGS